MNLSRLEDRLDRVLAKAPYALLWFAVMLVVISIASQTYMWAQRRTYAGPERDSVAIAGSGEYAPYERGRVLEVDVQP